MLSRHAAHWAVAAFGLFLAGLGHSVFADATSEFEARREEERRNYETMIAGMPLLSEPSARDLLRITMESKALVVRTPLTSAVFLDPVLKTPRDGYMRVKIADMGISGLIRVQGGVSATGTDPVIPGVLQFNLTDYTRPRQITTLSVNTQQSYCAISKSSQFPGGGYRNVSLMQQAGPTYSAGGGSIQLTVNEAGREGSPPLNIEVQAPDFFTLIRGHQGECDQYIRPLLRELGQETVFAPDPLIAWQVFAELWKPDANVSRQVQTLLPGLNDDSFRARGKTFHELEKLGREGAAVLIHLDRTDLTPEQNARVDLALAPYAQLPLREAVRLRSDLIFLLDCLYSEDAGLRQVTLTRLREITDPSIQFDLAAAAPARAVAVAALRQRLVRPIKP